MPNSNYIKGVKKERMIVNIARTEGKISFRSAGSHSPVDVVIIDSKGRRIKFIQCKPKSMPQKKKDELADKYLDLNGSYSVTYEVI